MPAIAVSVCDSDEERLVDGMVSDDRLKEKVSDCDDGFDVEPGRRQTDEDADGLPSPGCSARFTFIALGSLGFFNVYALRVNLSVALISMVRAGGSKGGNFTPVCGSQDLETFHYRDDNEGEFDWDEPTQGLILGSFFWGYIVTQIPGGILVKYTGSKWMLGLGCFITALFSLLTPVAARHSVAALIAVRVVEGVGEGVTFPAMHALIAKWAPPFQRSMFSAVIYGGATAGLVISMPICGLLAESSFMGGWPSVFYVFGLLGVVWFFFWIFLVFEDPDSHPWISISEKRFIKNAIGHQVEHEEDHGVPYRAIFTSLPFWAILVAHVGQNWGFYTLLTQLPSYVKNVLGFDVGASGFVSALPYLCLYIVAVSGSALADYLRQSGTMSTTAVRKCYTGCAFGFAGLFLSLVSFLGCNVPAVIAIISLAGGFDGLTHSGFNVNHIDIAPNYAGVLLGFTNCAATVPGIVAPYVTGLIINGDQSVENWRTVFVISSGIFVAAGIFYLMFASGEEQPWNRARGKGRRDDDEADETRSVQKSLMVHHSDDEILTN